MLAFWSASQPSDNLSYAAPINPDLVTTGSWAAGGEGPTAVIYIEGGGLTWEDIGVIYIVCTICPSSDGMGGSAGITGGGLGAIIGQVILSDVPPIQAASEKVTAVRLEVQKLAGQSGLLAPPPPPLPPAPPPGSGNGSVGPAALFSNCAQGVADKLNM